jgi:site-specific DNA-cytosine methylase
MARDVVRVGAELCAPIVAVESVRAAERWATQMHDRIWAEFHAVYPGQMWVRVNAVQHGLPQNRPRVFWLLAPEVFTLEPPPRHACPTIRDCLAGVPRDSEPAVPANASYVCHLPPSEQVAILDALKPGKRLGRMHHDWIRVRSPKLAEAMAGRDPVGYLPKRLRNDALAPVVMGWAARHVHPTEPRYLTQRELSRLCGFPDAWVWAPQRPGPAQGELGQNVLPPVAAWLAREVAAYVRGERAGHGPGSRVVDIGSSQLPLF